MKASRLALLFVACVGVALLVVCIFPASRAYFQHWVDHGSGRELLASVDGDVLNNGTTVKVIKYQGPETVFLEIVDPNKTESLIARIVLPDKHDGLFNLHGRITRLANVDVDGDGQNELLAPTFDDQLVPHLNIYRYDPATTRFEAVKPP
jgi:hypothetical protein